MLFPCEMRAQLGVLMAVHWHSGQYLNICASRTRQQIIYGTAAAEQTFYTHSSQSFTTLFTQDLSVFQAQRKADVMNNHHVCHKPTSCFPHIVNHDSLVLPIC